MKHIFLILLTFFTYQLFAQASRIEGVVIDKNTGDKMPSVTVVIPSLNVGGFTDENGHYQFDVNVAGKLAIEVKFVGYRSLSREITIALGQTLQVNFELEEEVSQLTDVVIVAPKVEIERKSMSAASVSVISNEVIAPSPTKNVSSLAATTPGVKIVKTKPSLKKKEKLKPQVVADEKKGMKKGNRQTLQAIDKEKGETTVTQKDEEDDEDEINEEIGANFGVIVENQFKPTNTEPISTFSSDVDRAAYSTIRRMIDDGDEIPVNAVRIEEMINYFPYQYPQPQGNHPVAIHTEYSACPWNHENALLKVALQAKEIQVTQRQPVSLTFLIDVSGSMSGVLPLLKDALKLLVDKLTTDDKVAIVVYAGAAGLVLPTTSGDKKAEIIAVLDKLEAGGSTAGGAGITLAYEVALKQFIANGNNRVILATDGDFNVGISNVEDLTKFIEEKRKSNVFLTCLGLGDGGYNDQVMETLADKGNGNYAFIDNITEAKKVLVEELTGTLITVAKDVKIQVKFNANKVAAYRLVGYENRMLNTEDFENDAKDAGEVGAGHTVTAIYEIVPTQKNLLETSPALPYTATEKAAKAAKNNELALVKVRYKQPTGLVSTEIQQAVPFTQIRWADGSETYKKASADFQFAAVVAMWGLILRKSPFVKNGDIKTVLEWAELAKSSDIGGYRAEFMELVKEYEEQ